MLLDTFFNRFRTSRILIYADFIDPFCYIGFHCLSAAAQERAITLEWRGFELNPDTPEDGFSLESASNSDLRPGMWSSVQEYARKSGLEVREPGRVPNTRRAHQLVYFAQKIDVKKPLIERIYQAYFTGKGDIGNLDVLVSLAGEFGFSEDDARRAILANDFAPKLEQRRQEAIELKFAGMPGYVWKGKNYFGALSTTAWENIFQEVIPAKAGIHRFPPARE